ncbi:hypothetical protein MJO28_001171 [Puccinia striiformis f. sp. tritici]|uniref:Uncharacterized protein n=1 Tax=Puccinia striiformis f. sp. tritici TaxID=168172 RepID=A0ACC0F043_9BASI|nr:hypothetical protein MJO28_001171 [Puccinia striiformis f. sp. tritici]
MLCERQIAYTQVHSVMPSSNSNSTKTQNKTNKTSQNNHQQPLHSITNNNNRNKNKNYEGVEQQQIISTTTRLSTESEDFSSNTNPTPTEEQQIQLATANTKKRKPLTTKVQPTIHYPLQSTPKRQKTEPSRPSSNIHQSILPTRPTPTIPAGRTTTKTAVPSFELLFTTQRYKTPGKGDTSTSTIANGEPPPPLSSGSGNSKGKAKEKTRLKISNHDKPRPRSRSNYHDHHTSSDESEHGPRKIASSSSHHPHTPRHPPRNPHIYGLQDQQTDGEISLVIAETPMHHKNRQFRKGGPPGKQKNEQAELGHGTGPTTPLSSQSLQSFDSGHGSGRRGSRASSIGSGHEALPHPRILPSMLCRHIRTDLPPSMRCRTLLSWCSQKAENVTYTVLDPKYQPKRYITEELPKPLARRIGELVPLKAKGEKVELLNKVIKSALQNFIQGICENQVEISWAKGLPIGPDDVDVDLNDDDHQVSVENLSILDIQALPPHPQDIKNERKIEGLNIWRNRLTYEDHARQYQLKRYGRLIERMTLQNDATITTTEELLKSNRFNPPNENGIVIGDGLKIDTKLLTDRTAVLEFGKFLGSRPIPIPQSIDVLAEFGFDWNDITSQIGQISEQMKRVTVSLNETEERLRRLQISSTTNLRQVTEQGTMSTIEAKILLSSMDGVQLCLKSLSLSNHHSSSMASSMASLEDRRLGGTVGKRDLLRTLSRAHHHHLS